MTENEGLDNIYSRIVNGLHAVVVAKPTRGVPHFMTRIIHLFCQELVPLVRFQLVLSSTVQAVGQIRILYECEYNCL